MKLDQRRDGRVVECGGLEIRCTARYRGFESLSLRNKGCKSAGYAICALFYIRNFASNKTSTQNNFLGWRFNLRVFDFFAQPT